MPRQRKRRNPIGKIFREDPTGLNCPRCNLDLTQRTRLDRVISPATGGAYYARASRGYLLYCRHCGWKIRL